MRADKRCAAIERALQVVSAPSEMQRVKIHLRKTLQNRSKYMYENRFAAMSSLHRQLKNRMGCAYDLKSTLRLIDLKITLPRV